jgi:hypothetical protein
MKKAILSVILNAFFIFPIFSQKIGLGLRYGVGLNSVSASNTTGTTSQFSPFNIGLMGELSALKFLSIQPEIFFQQKGFDQNGGPGQAKYNYLGLCVLGKLKFVQLVKLESYLLAGPSFSYNLSTALSNSATTTIPNVSSTDVSGIAGLGFAVKFGKEKIFIDGRYNMALKNANTLSTPTLFDYKLNQIGINLGFIHNL